MSLFIILEESRMPKYAFDIYWPLKFIYSEKATKFCKIYTIYLTGTTKDKTTLEISQNFAAFSVYMNFNIELESWVLMQILPYYVKLPLC